jgi:UDP:flavonoid glycosyltransferase YjiC (YdhE family)
MKTVLVAVLDWGLGHATRSIPIIRELQNQHVRVVLAGNGASLSLLTQEFPSLRFY